MSCPKLYRLAIGQTWGMSCTSSVTQPGSSDASHLQKCSRLAIEWLSEPLFQGNLGHEKNTGGLWLYYTTQFYGDYFINHCKDHLGMMALHIFQKTGTPVSHRFCYRCRVRWGIRLQIEYQVLKTPVTHTKKNGGVIQVTEINNCVFEIYPSLKLTVCT